MDHVAADDMIAFPPLPTAGILPKQNPKITNTGLSRTVSHANEEQKFVHETSEGEEATIFSDDDDDSQSSLTLESRLQLAAGLSPVHLPAAIPHGIPGTASTSTSTILFKQIEVGVSLLAENKMLKEENARICDEIKLYRAKNKSATQRVQRIMGQLRSADESMEQMHHR